MNQPIIDLSALTLQSKQQPPIAHQRLVRWLLIALTVVVYAQTLGFDFVSVDDPDYVVGNDIVKQGLTSEGAYWAMTTGAVVNWHPLTWISLMLDAEIQKRLAPVLAHLMHRTAEGLYPGVFHFTNVLFHCLNVWLVISVFHLLTGAFYRSALLAALLAIHPMHVESVAWISERKDVLSMFFMLLTLRAYVFYARDRDLAGYIKVLLYLTLGLMCKPMLVTLPCVLLLLDAWPLRRLNSWRVIIEKIPMFAIAAASSFVTYMLQVSTAGISDGVRIPINERLENVAVSYVRYIGKLFWPTDLAMLYPNPSHIGIDFWSTTQVAAALGVLVAITLAIIVFNRRRGYPLVGWLWFLGTMTPVIGFVQIGRHAMADRYSYIPYLGLYLIIAWALGEIADRWKSARSIVLGAIAIALLTLSIVTYRQIGVWRNSDTLFEHTLAVTKDNWVVHSMMGGILAADAFNLQYAGRYDESRKTFERSLHHHLIAIEIAPTVLWERDLLADVYDSLNRHAESQAVWERSLEMNPDRAKSHWGLALILAKQKRLDEAIHHTRRAVGLEPNTGEAHFYLGMVLSETDALDEAIASIERGFALDPTLVAKHGPVLVRMKAARQQAGNSP